MLLSDHGFKVEACVSALLKDKIGVQFFIHARDSKVLNRLIKKCERRGATLLIKEKWI